MLRIISITIPGLLLCSNLMADAAPARLNARVKSFGEVLPRQDTTGLSATTLAALRNIAKQLEKERRGACVLLRGTRGTGKTQAAGYLGTAVRRHVYRVDLSAVMSEYIGETEKNLNRVMEQAAKNDWILLFDEADALFARRSEVRDAHDRYANVETGYILERLEHYKVMWILATNRHDALHPAVTRRCAYQLEIQLSTP